MNSISREDGYIDLAVLCGEKVDAEWHNSDRETLMEQKYLQMESINIENIWTSSDQLVVIRGVAGIGKSTLIQRYVLKWARNEILADEQDKVDFLFIFQCRDLNMMQHVTTFEELLKTMYPGIFNYISFNDLKKISDRVMIIVDGLDELQGIYVENDSLLQLPREDPPKHVPVEVNTTMRDIVKDIVNTKSTLLKGHKTIACGRPKACEIVKLQSKEKQRIKTIEVCGFSEKKSIEYIDTFFKSHPQKAEKVKEVIRKPNLRIMASVPIFLWVICLLYTEDFESEINSVTELYIYGLFTFLKNHLRGCRNLENQSLSDIITIPLFGEIVHALAKLSVKTYMKHQVVFTDEDIKHIKCPIHLEQTGFIVKHPTTKFCLESYQFKHLAFQEFLCALYLCLVKGVSKYNTNRELSSCTPTILGIHWLLKKQKNKLFMAFYQNLTNAHKASRGILKTVRAPYENLMYRQFINLHLKWSKMIGNHIKKLKSGGCEFNCDTNDIKFIEFLQNCKEIGYLFDEETIKLIAKSLVNVSVPNRNKGEVVDLLKAIGVPEIHNLYLIAFKEEFEQGDIDLLRMALPQKLPCIKLNFLELQIGCTFAKDINGFSSGSRIGTSFTVFIPSCMAIALPLVIKEATETFILNDERFETNYLPFVISDLLGYVLENHKSMKIMNSKPNFGTLIEQEFGGKDNFNECITIVPFYTSWPVQK